MILLLAAVLLIVAISGGIILHPLVFLVAILALIVLVGNRRSYW